MQRFLSGCLAALLISMSATNCACAQSVSSHATGSQKAASPSAVNSSASRASDVTPGVVIPSAIAPTGKRLLRPSDLYRIPTVSDPQLSPKGDWIAYTVSTIDSIKDRRTSAVWMISWDGSQDLQLTTSPEGESRPRWSPDGKYLSFMSSRNDSKGSQVWLMDRRGGEGKKLTDIKGGVDDYAWSPDSKKLLLTLTDQEPEDTGKIKTTKPYVIDRYQYKQDVEGYRYKKLYTHLYLFDIAAKKIDTLTRGPYIDGTAGWSPDGSAIVFVSNRTEDPDKNENSDIYIIDARPGAALRQLTTWRGQDNSPRWSPDGKWIVYTRSTFDADYSMYDQPIVCTIAASGGDPLLLTKSLDRPVTNPRWSKDGKSVIAQVADDRTTWLAAFSVSDKDSKPTRIADGQRSFGAAEATATGSYLTTMSDPTHPNEIYIIDNGSPRQLTHKLDSFLAPLDLASVEGFTSTSSDGTKVSGLLYLPPTSSPSGSAPSSSPSGSATSPQPSPASSGSPASPSPSGSTGSSRLPFILFVHGGPVGQDEYAFDIYKQMLAAGGYAVAGVNYRGSSGRGIEFCKVISGDWGNKEVIDLHGAVDYLVKRGVADPSRLGVGGWSYGGILTDYLIASDTRFKAAASGAGTGFTLALYGVDQYISQYNNEIGAPWKSIDRYLKISYPLLKADRIRTPTLFMSGEKDFNVPTAGSEQMYQALRTLGIPTELIIYPGQFHGITIPSYQRDRFERYLAWFGKYLK